MNAINMEHHFLAAFPGDSSAQEKPLKHLCGEKSVDVEKPESSWGTTGEQLPPNKMAFARTRASRPPYVVDSEQQRPRRCLLL